MLLISGILKNSNSYQAGPSKATSSTPPTVPTISETASFKDLTLQNTLQNAGPRRRSSSTNQAGSLSRRQSGVSQQEEDENSPRLKWDEANLYLTEQERTAKMKIDEPKTPYAPHYDPAQDDEEMRMEEAQESLLDAQDIVVDELDRTTKGGHHKKGVSENDIPDLELGEPEDNVPPAAAESETDARIYRDRRMSTESQKGEKHVVVGAGAVAGEVDGMITGPEAEEKHRQFEQHRKKHYEMKNIKELLA